MPAWWPTPLPSQAEFFSFGTNDLTQTTLGISRDDYGPFISVYTDPKKADVLAIDPFATIDQDGVGALMKMGVEKRSQRPNRFEDRHLRRTRRRSGQRDLLPQDRAGLRELLPVPRAGGSAGGGAGGFGEINAYQAVLCSDNLHRPSAPAEGRLCR